MGPLCLHAAGPSKYWLAIMRESKIGFKDYRRQQITTHITSFYLETLEL